LNIICTRHFIGGLFNDAGVNLTTPVSKSRMIIHVFVI